MARETAMRTIDKWKVQDSADLYGVPAWGKGFFHVAKSGNLVVHPEKRKDEEIDLKDLIDQLQARGISTPVLLRFPGILRRTLGDIRTAFDKAIKEAGYDNKYLCIYPIKVNQQSYVVREYLEFARPLGFGIEAGSKPELLAILALIDDTETPIICNGFKDEEYIETTVLAGKIGRKIIPVVEKFSELEMLVRYGEKHGVRPVMGARVKLASRGVGRWESSAGIRSKFGLTIPEIMKMLEYLRERQMEDCFQLLHFHMGSQVSNIRHLKGAITEAARIYVELKKAGAAMEYLDVGGGLGVDYDGSQTNFESSINYTLEEYANDVVWRIKTVCDDAEVPVPTILSESGRAVTSYHSMLIFNVLGRSGYEDSKVSHLPEIDDDTPQPLRSLYEINQVMSPKTFLEDYHDATQARDEAIHLFNLGYLSLEDRAACESIFWNICERVRKAAANLDRVPEELEGLEEIMADTYFCNFSLFQSMPDSWAISQLFPIMPIHRLNEEPRRRAVLADITCDSDGQISQFVHPHDIKKSLELHQFDGGKYYLGVFLVGAYQEILGDLHNLFGDTNTVHVDLNEEGEIDLKHVVEGDTVADVLTYVQFDPKELISNYRREVEKAVRKRRITVEESALLLRFYIDGINGYTYLEEPTAQSVLSRAEMPTTQAANNDKDESGNGSKR